MSTTPNLLISHIAAAQNNKEVTANTGFDDFDGAITGLKTVAMANTDQTLSNADALYNMVFVCTGVDTADRNLILPQQKKLYIVSNQTTGGYNIIVKTAAGGSPTTVTLSNPNNSPLTSEYSILYCDGSNVILIK